MDNNYFLNEIYGMAGDEWNRMDTQPGQNPRDQQRDVTLRSGLHRGPYWAAGDNDSQKHCTNFAIWQQWFSLRIMKKQDCFMAVPPGAGKTSPILYAYLRQFSAAHGFNNLVDDTGKLIPSLACSSFDNLQLPTVGKQDKDFPRMLYIGRTKQLSAETFSQNIRDDKTYGLIKTIIDHPDSFRIHIPPEGINRDTENQIIQLINDHMLGLSIGNIVVSPTSSQYRVKCVYISTPSPGRDSKLINLLRSYGDYFNTIIIDESQNYMIKPHEIQQKPEDDIMFEMYIDIIRMASKPGKCGVHLLTGTTNYETADKLMDEILNAQLKLLIYQIQTIEE